MYRVLLAAGVAAAAVAGPAAAETFEDGRGGFVEIALGAAVAGKTEASASGASGSVDIKPGPFAAVAAGDQIDDHVRLEGELLFLRHDFDPHVLDAQARTLGVMANVIYSFRPADALAIDLGGGVGYGRTRMEAFGASGSDGGFMWQAIAGLRHPVSKTWSLGLQYRYIHTPELGDSSGKLHTNAHVVAVTSRSNF